MLIGTVASVVLVFTTIMVHFEFLRLAQRLSERSRLRPRLRVVALLMGAFAAHTVEVYVYTLAYMAIDWIVPGAQFTGIFSGTFEDFLYFSAATYTSLGYGDIVPHGPVRLLAGTEALNGLILIAWTASVTYLMMERYWRRE
jgi:hypothetical protein